VMPYETNSVSRICSVAAEVSVILKFLFLRGVVAVGAEWESRWTNEPPLRSVLPVGDVLRCGAHPRIPYNGSPLRPRLPTLCCCTWRRTVSTAVLVSLTAWKQSSTALAWGRCVRSAELALLGRQRHGFAAPALHGEA